MRLNSLNLSLFTAMLEHAWTPAFVFVMRVDCLSGADWCNCMDAAETAVYGCLGSTALGRSTEGKLASAA